MSEGFEPHWKDDISNEDYHADKEFVSSSQLKYMINESPAYYYDRLLRKSCDPTESMALGTLVHHAVLEGEDFIKRYVVMPKFEGHANSLVHKQAKREWLAAHKHKVIVTEEEIKTLEGTYESIFKHQDAAAILTDSRFERSGYYRDPATGILCRIRYDSYDENSAILADIKAVRSCKRGDFTYAIRDYRWDLSMAMYGYGIKQIDGKAPDNFVFIAVEKTPPYHCAVYELGKESLQVGFSDYRLALNRLEECREANVWPSYQSHMEEIELPQNFIERRINER